MSQELAASAENRISRAAEPTMLDIIREASIDPRVDVDKLAALMGLQERVEARDAERQFNADFCSAKLEMPRIAKRGKKDMGGKGIIPYATYEDLDAAIKPIEAKYGFTRSFVTVPGQPHAVMTLKLRHRGGHCENSSCIVAPDKGPGRNDIQEVGSGRSYAKRYLTKDIWDVITIGEDDDGNKAGAISQDQADTINSLISEIGMTAAGRDAFFKLADVQSIEEIPQRRYRDIMQALQSKRAAKK